MPDSGCTVMVNVTLPPATCGFGLAAMIVVVAIFVVVAPRLILETNADATADPEMESVFVV